MGKDTRHGLGEFPAHSTFSPLSLEDAALLADAHEQLLADQAAGVRVLGSTAGGDLLATARRRLAGEVERDLAVDAVLDEFDVQAEQRMEAALVSAERLARRDEADELDVRRERRAAARALRGAA